MNGIRLPMLNSLSLLVEGTDHQREQLCLALPDWSSHLYLENTIVPQQRGESFKPSPMPLSVTKP